MALRSWIRQLFARPAARTVRKKARARNPLLVERLEDRTLLTVSVVPGPGNTVGILGTVGDQVWLRTNSAAGNSAQLQYSIDATNYSDLGVNVAHDTTITLGDMGHVHLMSTSGQGHAITLQALGAPSGDGGQLASPRLLTFEGTIATAGGDLSILNMQGIEVSPNVIVSTRNVGASTDYLNAPSVGDSGALTFTSENPDTLNPYLNVGFNHPHITLGSGARILAQVGAGDATHKAGDITLSAQNTNSSIASTLFSNISLLTRAASVNLAGATVKGGRVEVNSLAGDAGLDPLDTLAQLGGGNATWATGFLNNIMPFLTSFVPFVPVSFLFKKADATLEVGQGTAQTFDPAQVNSATGEIAFGSATNLSTGDPVTYTSTGTAIGGLTSGATYFAIVDSPTTLRLAASRDKALQGVPLSGVNAAVASGTQSLSPDSQIAGADVNLDSEADADAEGFAVFTNSDGKLSADALVHSGLTPGGFAFAITIGIPSAQTLVDPGSQITTEGDADVTSTANSTTVPVSRISQNLGGVSAEEAMKLANATLKTEPRVQVAAAVGVNELTSHTIVSRYASIDAGGNAAIKATGTNTDKTTVQSASYYDGTAGVTAAFNYSKADVQALVDGVVTAGGPGSIGNSPTAPVTLTFNPFTGVHGSNDPTEPNTIDLGPADPGLKTGDEIVYDSGLGGAIDGLTSGATYYVIDASVAGDHRLQLARSRDDALAKRNVVVLPANPTLTDTVTHTTLPITQVDESLPYPFDPATGVANNAIQFPFPHGLTPGHAVTYTTTGTPLTGLHSGQTYYAIVLDATHIQLASSYANATAATPVALPISGAGAAGTQTVTAQTPIPFGFAPGFHNGDKLLYTAAPGKRVNPLVDGSFYYAVTDPNHPSALLLSATPGGAPLQLDLSPVLTSPDGAQTYTITAVDADSSSFLFDPARGYRFSAGQPLVYQGALGTTIPGLTSGATYYAVVDANNPYAIQLAPSPGAALAASAAATQLSTAESQASTLTAGDTVGTIVELNPDANEIVFTDPPPGFATGTPLLFHQAPGKSIGGLSDGQTYFALAVPGDPNAVRLSLSRNGPAIVLDPFSRLAGTAAGDTRILDLQSSDPTTGTLNLASAPDSPVATGDAFVYHAALGNGIQGLADGQTYYAIVLADPTTLQVAASRADALTGKAVALSATFTDQGGNSFLIQRVDSTAHTTSLYAPLQAPLQTGDAVVYHANGVSVPGLQDGATYYVVNNQQGGINPVHFTPGQVATGGSAVTVPNHRFYTGEPVTYTTSGTPIGGLSANGTYYVIVLDSNTIELASSLTNAQNGEALTLSQTVAGGIQTLTPPAAAGNPVQFAPSPVVDPVAHTIALPSHGFVNGEAVTYTVAAGGTPIQNLTPGQVYYVIAVNDDTIQLADSEAHAQAGTALAVSATGAGGTQTFTPLQGSNTAATIDLTKVGATTLTLPGHGYVTGQTVAYATTGTEIGGLSNAAIYYVIVVDGNTIRLAGTAEDAFAGNAITLDPTGATGTQSLSPVQGPLGAVSFIPSAVRPAGSRFTLQGHGFVTGEAVTYTSAGTPIEGLTSGTTYYVIVVDGDTVRLAADQADAYSGVALPVNPAGASGTQTLAPSQPVLQLAASRADATAAVPVVLSLGGAIDFGDVDNTVMSGTRHTLTAAAAPGIVIKATLSGTDGVKTKSGLGSAPSAQDLLTRPELAGQAVNTLTNIFGPKDKVTADKNGKKSVSVVGNPVTDSIKNASGLGKGVAGPTAQSSLAGSLGLIYTNFTVTAEVGSHAVLKSAKNVTVEATVKEKEQTSVEATVSKPGAATAGETTKLSVAVALEVVVFNATANALVDPNATIDAAGSLTVHASTTYPFVFPFRDPSAANLTKTFGSNPLSTLTGPFLSGNLGLQSFFVNNWTRTVSAPSGAAPLNAVGGALTLDVNVYQNSAVARIGSGARINQDPVYQTLKQSVAVAAETAIDEVNITGMFGANLSPDYLAAASRKRTILAQAKEGSPEQNQFAYEQLFSPFGNRAGSAGLGVSAPITVVTTTATAEIDSGALVRVGPSGSLNVTANDRNFFLIIAQSGGQAKTLGFSGTLSVLDVTAHTTAQIQGGATVTGGGAVTVSASDDSNLINLTGALQTSQEASIGVSVAINVLDRNTLALIGDRESSPTATDTPTSSSTYGSPAAPLGDVTVRATETGNLITSAIAAAVVSDVPPAPALGGSVSANYLKGEPTAADLFDARSGIGASGAVGLNLLTADNVEAYINDAGTFHVSDVNVTANNASHIVSVTGGVGVTLTDRSTVGLAGSLSTNTMNGTTRAFIVGPDLTAGDLTVSAERSGFSFALTAGVQVATSQSGADLAVAVAVNTMGNDTEAFVRDANVTLVGDAKVTAVNDDQIWAIDGSDNFGGALGLGAAVSVNLINDRAYAFIIDSVVNQSGGALTMSASDQNFGAIDARVLAVTASVGVSSSLAANGTVAVNTVSDDTEAFLSGTVYTNATAGESATVTATSTSGIVSLAGAAAVTTGAGKDSGAIGAAVGVNVVNDITRAYLEGSTATLLGDLDVTANSRAAIGSLTVGVGLSLVGLKNGLAGSVSINEITDTIDAHIGRAATADPGSRTGNVSSVQTSGNVTLSATDSSTLVGLAGGFAFGYKAAGASLGYNLIQNTLTTYVDGSAVTSGGGVSLSANSAPVLVSIAVGGALAGNYAFGGALTVNAIDNTVNSHVTGSTVSARNSVGVTASESPVMVVLAGGVGLSVGSSAAGAAIAVNTIGGSFDLANPDGIAASEEKSSAPTAASDRVGAFIENSSVTATTGDVTVLAGYYQTPATLPGSHIGLPSAGTVTLPVPVSQALVSIAVGAAGGSSFALGGSVNVNLMRGTTDAHITSTDPAKQVAAGGNVRVAANDGSSIYSAAGALAVSINSGAVGAAVSYNDIANTVASRIERVTVRGSQVKVGSTENATIVNLTAAGAGAGSFALGGSLSLNLIRNTVDAHIGQGANVTGTSLVNVAASDTSSITSLSGAGTFALDVAAGVAAAVNDISNTTNAYVDGSGTSVTASAGDVVVSAVSTPSVTTLAAGLAVSVNPDLTSGVAVAGSGAVNILANHTAAFINGATVTADGDVAVLAKTDVTLHTWAGSLDGASLVGVGGAVAVNYLGNDTEARIDGGAHVTARGHGSALSVDRWAHDAGGTASTQLVHGLAVIASTQETIFDLAMTMSAALGGGIGLNVEVNVFSDTTDAHIANSFVNAANDPGQSVIVRAHNALNVSSAGGALSAGAAGVGAVVDTDVYSSETRAYVSGSTVFAGGDVEVSALTREDVTSAAAGASIGGLAFAGGASGVNIGGSTSVSINANSAVSSRGNLTVQADDGITLHLGDGVLAGGGGFGAGGAIAVALVGHATSATIDSSTTNATGQTLVEADGTESLLDVAIAAGVGGIVGVAGAISVVSLGATVTAVVVSASINQDDGYRNAGQNVTVRARGNASVTDGIGAAAGAFLLGAGVGAGVDVISIKDVVNASIGDGSRVSAGGNITVEADGDKTFSSNVFSFAVSGGTSLNGTVSVVGIGSGLDSRGVSQLQNVQGTVNKNVSQSGGAPGLNPNIGSSKNANARTRTNAMDISGALSTDQTAHDTQAHVGSNVTLTAGGDISVTANETLHPSTALVGQGSGGLLSVGAAVAVVSINSAVQAFVQDGTTLSAGGNVTVASHFTDNVSAKSFAGTIGYVASLGVQASILTDDAVEIATLGNVQVTRARSLTVNATADRTLDAEAAGGTVAQVAAGAAVANASAHGSTNALLGGQIGQAAGKSVGAVTVSATSADSARAFTVAVAAGIGAAGVNVSQATIDPNVLGAVSDNAAISSTGAVRVTAQETPHADASTVSAVVAAVGIGANISNANVGGTTASYLGNGVTVSAPGLFLDAERTRDANNDPTARSSAAGGAGALLASVNATVSTATSGGTVQATTGTGVTLGTPAAPLAGNVTIVANNRSDQVASATGVAVGGLLAVGVDVANASSGVATSAQLGGGAQTNITGTFTVSATGSDENDATSTAGSGGLAAGNASVGNTSDTSTATAGLNGGAIRAGTVQVMATNISTYLPNVSSVNADLAGGSGAQATNTDTTSASATVGDNTSIAATGAVAITAENLFFENGGSVSGGAGGVINGAAASSQTNLTGTASVVLGNAVGITVMAPPNAADTRGILLSASNTLNATDTVTLSTGAAIESDNTDSSLTAGLTNGVTVGAGDVLMTNANISAGTNTNVSAAITSQSSTGGLGAGTVSSGALDVTSNQTVTVGAGAALSAAGNIDLSAGVVHAPGVTDPTSLSGSVNAQSFVNGGVAVADAHATANVTSNAALNVAAGAVINSGENTNLAADPGTPSAVARGIGHATSYLLFGIPISVTNGSSAPHTATSSNVTMDGAITAGYDRKLDITIPDDKSADGFYSNTVIVNPDGSPFAGFTQTFDPNFNPAAAITSYYGPFPTPGQQAAEQALLNNTSSTPVGAMILSPLFATGGLVTVNAGAFQGGGSITTYSGPTITVTNNSPDYLILSGITIPNLAGGQVVYTGRATAAPAGMTVHVIGAGVSPVVTVRELYPQAVGGPSASGDAVGPAVFLTGPVLNEGGEVAITSADGSVAQLASINAGRLSINAPNGALVISDPQPYGIEHAGPDPAAVWDPFMIWPGGDPSQVVPNAPLAAAWVANALYNADGPRAFTAADFTRALIGFADRETPPAAVLGSDGIPDHYPATPQPIGAIPSTFREPTTSIVFYGGNSVLGPGEPESRAVQDGPIHNAVYAISNAANRQIDNNGGDFPLVPVEPVSTSVASYPLPGPNASPIQAAEIVITANILDIDSKTTVGRTDSASLLLPASLDDVIAQYQADYAQGIPSATPTDAPGFYTLPAFTLAAGDTQITAQYNAITRQIVVNDARASSGTGFAFLDGHIISTNQYNAITVNSGVGQVQINNQTSYPIVVHNVSAGGGATRAAALPAVEIIDRNKQYPGMAANLQTLYVYQPDGTVNEYDGPDQLSRQQLEDPNYLVKTTGAGAANYRPLGGLLWQWQLQANLSRSVDLTAHTNTPWTFATPPGEINNNNPWYYLDASGNPTPALGPSASTPFGQLVFGPPAGAPAFSETVTGSVNQWVGLLTWYHNGTDPWSKGADDGWLPTSPPYTDPANGQVVDPWYTYYATDATLLLTMQTRADNAIGIQFTNQAQGGITIQSTTPVILAGSITDADGDVSIDAASITQTPSASITANNLTLTTHTGDIGTSSQPVRASLADGGVLNILSGDNTYLDLDSGARLGTVDPAGDVVIHATGSLDAADSNSVITAHNLTLTSAGGEVGTAAARLNLQVTGVVNVTAALDIGLTQQDGVPFQVGQIVSTNGDVTLVVFTAPIVNAGGTIWAQEVTDSQSQQVWQSLGLVDPAASPQSQLLVSAFENKVNTAYRQYWQLLDNGSVQNGVLTLNAQGVALYTLATAQALGIDAADVTTAQVQTYANKQYQALVAFFNRNLPAGWVATFDFLRENTNFSYHATPQQIAALTTTGWTASQLMNSVPLVALDPASSTPVAVTTPNVAGVDVTLRAQGDGASIGEVASTTSISKADIQSGNLTAAQAAALASASAPGDVVITPAGILVAPSMQLFVSASGVLAARGADSVSLQGTSQDLTLSAVGSAGDVNIAAPGSILSNGGGTQILAGGNVTLMAGTGSLGSPAANLMTSVDGSTTLIAPSGQIFVNGAASPLSPATGLAILPNSGRANGVFYSVKGEVTFIGTLSGVGQTVRIYDTATNQDLGLATVIGTFFTVPLTLSEGPHVLRARASLNGAFADASLPVTVDLSPPTSFVVNNLGVAQASASFPVSVQFNDPASSAGAAGSGVTSVDLYVSVNNGPFTLYQTQTLASPTASGTVTFNFAGPGDPFDLYAFHSIAHDAAGNTESKSDTANEAGTFSGVAATATAITSGLAFVTYGQADTFTATVSSAFGAPSDGFVQFLLNGAAYGSPVLLSDHGTAQLAITPPAGFYTVAAEYLGDANFAATLPAAESSGALIVTRAPLTVAAYAQSKVYGSADPVLTFAVSGLQLGDTAADALSGALARDAGETVVGGPYAITQGTLAAGANYRIDGFTGSTLTITPATLTVTADPQTKTYGRPDPALTYQASGFQFDDTAATALTGALTRAEGETVAGGPYAITRGSLLPNSNYTIAFTGNTLTITPATLTVTADPQSKVYGSADPVLTFAVSGFLPGDTAALLSGALSRAPGEAVAGGPYAITQGTLTAGSNYAIHVTGGSLTITPAALMVSADPQAKVYGSPDPALTYQASGFQRGDTAADLTGALARSAGEAVAGGPYAITQGTLADANYTITFTGNTLTITPAPLTVSADAQTKVYGSPDPALTYHANGLQFDDTAATALTGALARSAGETVAGGPYAITQGTLAANPNYTIAGFTGSTLTITPATLTVTADAQSKVYGSADPELTYAVSGLQLDDTAATALTGALTRAPGEAVAGGPYAITQGSLAADPDYTIQFTGNSLAITPAELTVTADPQTKVYGSPDPALTYQASGFQRGDTAAILSGALSREAGETVAGGPYAITLGTLTAGSNYAIRFTGNSLAVTPAELTVTADPQAKVYGSPDPALTYQASGFQLDDTAAILSGALSREAGETVAGGPYAFTLGTLTAGSNYTIRFTGSSLTVTPAELTVSANPQTKVYGSPDPALTFAASGFQRGDTAADLTGALARAAGEAVAGGPYAITLGTLADPNYMIAFTGNSLAITPAPLTVSADPQAKTYGSADPALTYAVSGLQRGDTAAAALTGALARAAGEAVAGGPYAITQGSLAADPDYTLARFTGNGLTITPAPLTITASDQTKAYGAGLPALTASYRGFVNGDTPASLTAPVALTTDAIAASRPGGYTIHAAGASDANYLITFVDGTLTVLAPPDVPPPAATPGAVATVGAFDPATAIWFLRGSNGPGAPDAGHFVFGMPGWIAVAGDWDGDGTTTIGVVDPSTMTWYLRNSNGPGAPDITPFRYGAPGWIPVVGDWNGDGTTTIGVVDPKTMTWYLRDSNGPGTPDITPFRYGAPGWIPVVGDWDGDGKTTIGVFDPIGQFGQPPATWYLKNDNHQGQPSVRPFAFGAAGWKPVVGDWDGDGVTTVGVVDPRGVWHLRDSNGPGAADAGQFAYGAPAYQVLAGAWKGRDPALRVFGGEGPGAGSLDLAGLNAVRAAALQLVQSAGASAGLLARLSAARLEIGSLPPEFLAVARPEQNTARFDPDAAGHGWFVDPTALADEEFQAGGTAVPGGPADGRVDLLSAMLHELAGLAGVEGGGVMPGLLAPGVRDSRALEEALAGH